MHTVLLLLDSWDSFTMEAYFCLQIPATKCLLLLCLFLPVHLPAVSWEGIPLPGYHHLLSHFLSNHLDFLGLSLSGML